MSDAPLFQNTDEQEKVYAPQQLPAGTAGESRAAVDDGSAAAGDSTADGHGPVVPVIAGAAASGAAGAGIAGGSGGGANPAIGMAALDTVADSDNRRPRDD